MSTCPRGDETWTHLLTDDKQATRLGALWGKSPERGGGQTNLLLQHLFDAMAVANILWSEFLAPGFRRRIDACAGGDGQRLYVWLCGLHDVGKASPSFQRQQSELLLPVRRAGLPVPDVPATGVYRWRHDNAGALLLIELLGATWAPDQLAWIWPMVAGHHGLFRPRADVRIPSKDWKRREATQGDDAWRTVQEALVHIVTEVAGWSGVAAAEPEGVPSRADQLALSGFITMADWIASDHRPFKGIDDFDDVSAKKATRRAKKAWTSLGLKGGWGSDLRPEPFSVRFGQEPRPSQAMLTDAVAAMPAPGIVVVEAPMGEGKTEAALSAAESLAAQFGASGLFVAMPTQATSDAMYERVRTWLRSVSDPPPALALLHGRRQVTTEQPQEDVGHALDQYGIDDESPSIDSVCEDRSQDEDDSAGDVDKPAEWFFGHRRGLLAANGVGTIDQALYAGTRTKYVALRYAGLAGKVVIFDEVHAADSYMSEFLEEVLWWLGNGDVPVVLLSATLSSQQRRALVESYVDGATVASRRPMPELPDVDGYPSALCAWGGAQPGSITRSCRAWRKETPVAVEVLGEPINTGASVAADRVGGGGCALVLHNTVQRAQETYAALVTELGVGDVVLLHSRLTFAERARRTEQLLGVLGPDGARRPDRLVVVSTQVAEQSFDVDADILVSDIAPIDLMLQRLGRIHRHDRPSETRPVGLRQAQLVAIGATLEVGAPSFPRGSEIVYGRHHLLRAAAMLIEAAAGPGWSIPADIRNLVERAYSDEFAYPPMWSDDAAEAKERWDLDDRARREQAAALRLVQPQDRFDPTLAGLHRLAVPKGEGSVRVRDGEMGEEVVLVQKIGTDLRTVEGLRLGPQGDEGRVRPRDVLGAAVRFPTFDAGLAAEVRDLQPLSGWQGDPWLGSTPALCLDDEGQARLGRWTVRYDRQLGLLIDRGADR